jgi:type II secretion system protein I
MNNSKCEKLNAGPGSVRAAGFTLLEILVALALLGTALIAVIRLFSSNSHGISLSEDYVAAVVKAESRMRELLDDEKLSEKDWSELTDEGYRIDASVKEVLKERTDKLQFKLLDIGITLYWRRGLRDRSFSLRTMKVINRGI